MTVSYAGQVPNGSSFGVFWKILFKWRGSVYKLIWRELIVFLCVYYCINFAYRYGLNVDQQRIFEKMRAYCAGQSETIPLSFVLGFYVTLIVARWWDQYKLLPWPDTLALFVSAAISGASDTSRLMRRNIVRYGILAYVITLQRISLRAKKRFPTLQHFVDAGLMLESERKIFEKMDAKNTMSKYWMPLVWATNIINRARREGLIPSDHIVQTLLVELSDIRKRLGALIGYDTVNVPLVYTQVVTLAIYSYFLVALMGRQMIPISLDKLPTGKYEDADLYFPFFTVLQFIFYIGWVKVAEVLINPFGEDDDDIEVNWLIDRHIKAAYMIVDEMHEEHPELLKDQFWEDVVPKELPYTLASEHYRRDEPPCSTDQYKVKEADAVYANMHIPRKSNAEDMYADYESVDTPLVQRRGNWFQRQISRMSSVRSTSTAYSTGGLFGRNRHNSIVYSNPEAGQGPPNNGHPVLQHKASLYDRLVGRKSGRAQHKLSGRQALNKVNGSVPTSLRNRPRMPTPDVTKEVVDRENRLSTTSQQQSGSGHGHVGMTWMPHGYPNEIPVLGALVLSPIQEMEGGSVNNTLHAGQPGTAALAQAVLAPAFSSAGISATVTVSGISSASSFTTAPMKFSPVTVGQLTSAFSPITTSKLAPVPIKSTPTTPTSIHTDKIKGSNQPMSDQFETKNTVEMPTNERSSDGSNTGVQAISSTTDGSNSSIASSKSKKGSNSNRVERDEVYV